MSNEAPACNSGAKDKKAKASEGPPCIAVFILFVFTFNICAPVATIEYMRLQNALHPPPPNFFIRLVGIEGFDPHASVPVPPTFHLAVDVDGVMPHYNACNGGGKSMLHVSYHGIILEWGNVPRFCVNGELIQQRADLVTIEAKAERAVLRQEIRCLLWSEQQAIGKAELDLEGDVAGLGSLSCKIFYSSSMYIDSRALCVIQ